MPTEQTSAPITEADVRTFAAKLDAWAMSLTPPERRLLSSIFARAAEEPSTDVQGFLMKTGPVDDDYSGSGSGSASHSSVSVNVSASPGPLREYKAWIQWGDTVIPIGGLRI